MTSSRARSLPHAETVTDAGASHPWLTMVHGASQHGGLFSAQIDAFRADYRLLLVDLPGHGGSASMPGPYGLVEYTRAVLAAIDAAGVERTHFWGTHTGAGVGLRLAAAHRGMIASLVLEGAVLPGVEMPYVGAAIARARATAREQGMQAAREEWFRESRWFDVMRARPDECRARAHRDLLAGFEGRPWLDETPAETVPSIRPDLPRIVQPVLLVNGEHDLDEFLQAATELEATLPHVERVSVPHAGGFPLWEYPLEVNRIVKAFLDRQPHPDQRGGR